MAYALRLKQSCKLGDVIWLTEYLDAKIRNTKASILRKEEKCMVETKQIRKPVPRSIYVLLMLYADNGAAVKGKLRLEKLMFLLDQMIRSKRLHIADRPYDFRAYSYGPFSEEVYDDVELLKDLGLVTISGPEEDPTYQITDKGKKLVEKMIQQGVLPGSLLNEINSLKKRWNQANLYSLLKYIYENYKEFTQKSLIRGRFE
jgi:uncharacterized protein YwgA